MPAERPAKPSSPDGDREHLFVSLDDEDPALANRLRRRYAERWIAEAHLSPPRLEDAMETIELKVGPDEADDARVLRLRSFYTGSTYWRHGWDGSEGVATAFMDEAAALQAANVGGERRHGPVLWDTIER